MMRQIERNNHGSMTPGQELVAAGYAGYAGSRRIAEERSEELARWFSKAYIRDLQKKDPMADALRSLSGRQQAEAPRGSFPNWTDWGATEWEEAGEGGIYTALWNLSGAYRLGFMVDLRRIPVKQGTIELCERYALNPYRLLSDGCVVLVSDNGGRLVQRLEAEGIAAAVIGSVRPDIVREIFYGDVHGFMERPREDELCRLGLIRSGSAVIGKTEKRRTL